MYILGITSCPSGVAHTYMAAKALEKSAKAKGHEVKVETQGSIGIENEITLEEVKNADVIILTNDTALFNLERFEGMRQVKVGISDLVRKSDLIISKVEQAIENNK